MAELNRIAILGWAPIEKGASCGGGYNLIAQQQSLYLREKGHEVFYLQAGFHFKLGRLIFNLKPRISFSGSFMHIKCFKVWNSHNWAPAQHNRSNLDRQLEDAEQNEIVYKWMLTKGINQIYIQSLEGQSLSLIPFLRERNLKVKVICHDYQYTCPRVSYLYKGNDICLDDDGGRKCGECESSDDIANYPIYRIIKGLLGWISFLKPKPKYIIKNKLTIEDTNLNGARISALGRSSSDLPWGIWQRRAIECLSTANRVLSPSRFLGESLLASGLFKDKLEIAKIGLPHLDQLKEMSIHGGPEDGRLHFAFRGGPAYNKGGSILLKAIGRLSDAYLERSVFHIWGFSESMLTQEQSTSNLRLYPSYRVEQLKEHRSLYHIGILSHLWFENSPVGLLEHLSSGKPVITPRLGGVEDYVLQGENGWYVKPGNADDLARQIMECIDMKELPSVDRNIVNSFKNFMEALNEC